MYPKLNTMKIKSISIQRESYYERNREPFKTKNKMYVWVSGETLIENLENRRNRPHNVYKKEVIPMVMEKMKKKYPKEYKELKDTKWGWRQKCGCSMCPCSPGFVSDTEGYITIQVEVTD